ncbi:hypothetical protein CCMA1212_000842 [Trichoderma ghanense]|uniref:FHA domain-containing protein n=1 Tax=Trichoderma ghanense TaxID=65468 RepID=A0ABY2HI62_9HYPO
MGTARRQDSTISSRRAHGPSLSISLRSISPSGISEKHSREFRKRSNPDSHRLSETHAVVDIDLRLEPILKGDNLRLRSNSQSRIIVFTIELSGTTSHIGPMPTSTSSLEPKNKARTKTSRLATWKTLSRGCPPSGPAPNGRKTNLSNW